MVLTRSSLVPRPLIQRMYRLQYNARKNVRDTESDPRWGWFESGTETKPEVDGRGAHPLFAS